jgi:alcohol dehydrogenase
MTKMILLSTAAVLFAFAVGKIAVNVPIAFELQPAKPSPSETMNAIIYNQHGDASTLQYQQVPRPEIRPHQLLIRVHTSSINPCDFKFRRKPTPSIFIPKPKIPGEDVAGEIVEAGAAVRGFKLGDRVAAMLPILGSRWGSAAEYVAVDASLVARLGATVSYKDAASLPLVALTVVQALAKVKDPKGKTILIQAGAGGVGTFAIQYAKYLGMKAIATTASANKHELLKELGADIVLDYKKHKFSEEIKNYDVVLDPMSWAYEEETFQSHVLHPSGHYLNLLSSDWAYSGKEDSNGLSTVKNCIQSKLLFRALKYDVVAVVPDGEQLQEVMNLLEKGTVRAVIDREFPLQQAQEAYEYLEQGHTTGKVILLHVPGDDEEEEVIS